MTYTVEDINKYQEENRDKLAEGIANCEEIPSIMKSLPMFKDLWAAGEWLGKMLREHGAEDMEVSDICFVHGQRSFGGDTKVEAVALANEYAATGDTEDKPGEELAQKINEKLLGSEANG